MVVTFFQFRAMLLFLMDLPGATQIGREWTHHQFYIIVKVVGSNASFCRIHKVSFCLSLEDVPDNIL